MKISYIVVKYIETLMFFFYCAYFFLCSYVFKMLINRDLKHIVT